MKKDLMRRPPVSLCAVVAMLSLAVPASAEAAPAPGATTTTTAAQAQAVTVTGQPGDVYTAAGTTIPAPTSDPADLIRASASDDGTTVHLTAATVSLNNPQTDPNWRNATYIAWLLDPTFSGHPRYAVYYTLDNNGDYAGSLFSFVSDQTVACQVNLTFDTTQGYQAQFPASCLAGATSFQWLVYSFYDTVASDTTGADAFGKSLPDFHSGASPFAGKASASSAPSGTVIPEAAPAVHAPTPTAYWLASASGGVYAFGSAHYFGSATALRPKRPVVAIVATPDAQGYWLATAAGVIYHFGDANLYGSEAGKKLAANVVAMAATPDGKGYWLATAGGAIYHFGDAKVLGSLGSKGLSSPIVGIAPTPDGKGYWLATRTGTVYHFGDARPFGSAVTGGHLSPIVNIAATPDGLGYWLVSASGAVYHFGDAQGYGSEVGKHLSSPIVGIAATSDGLGYRLVSRRGQVSAFGDARAYTDSCHCALATPIVGAASFG